MSKKEKVWLVVTAVISFVLSAIMILGFFFVLFNVQGLKDFTMNYIKEYLGATTEREINFQLTVTMGDFVVGALLNIYAGYCYLKYSKRDVVLPGMSRVLTYVALFQCLFILSLLPGIIGLIISARIRKREFSAPVVAMEKKDSMEILSERIELLKSQKASGLITEEQYNTLLNKLIEEEANNKSNQNDTK